MTGQLKFSRPEATAATLGGEASQRFTEKHTLLRGDIDVLRTPNGYEAFRAAFLMLVRVCQEVSLSIPPECAALRDDIEDLSRRIIPDRSLRILASLTDFGEFDAILSVGTIGRRDLPWTVINSNGWIAQVSSLGGDLPAACAQSNPISAIGAACLGVGEVFKRLIKLRSERGALLDTTSFSFWTYQTDGRDAGPELGPFSIDVLLVGCGAIGSGTAYVLSRLPVSGRAFALDRQPYRTENFGTSIFIGDENYNTSKAEGVAKLLSTKLETKPFPMDIATFGAQYDGSYPDIILTGLDDVDPRHEVQQLWPGLVIDGAVGAELTCQVSCHSCSGDAACLLCVFQKQPAASLTDTYARATGLPSAIANDPNAVITEEIVAAAREDRRHWLRLHLGKPICSITSEAVVKFLSGDEHKKGFAPAVPFVSSLSSCMIVSELYRYTKEGRTLPAPRFQLNLLWGPARGMHFPEDRKEDCYCVQRATNISRLRRNRQESSVTSQVGGG